MAMLSRFALGRSSPEVELELEPGSQPNETSETNNAAQDGSTANEAQREQLFQRKILDAKVRLHRRLIDEINLSAVDKASEAELRKLVGDLVSEYVLSERLPVNADELATLIDELLDEMTGLGPIEPLLNDPTVSDILINTHQQVYIERSGQLEKVSVLFRDEAHLLRIVNKIVSAVGRRVDESQPMMDARLLDGSRVNVAIRPVAVDGPLVSIRKFAKQAYDLCRSTRFVRPWRRFWRRRSRPGSP
jgi:pilus assembly protein CpaF